MGRVSPPSARGTADAGAAAEASAAQPVPGLLGARALVEAAQKAQVERVEDRSCFADSAMGEVGRMWVFIWGEVEWGCSVLA